MLESQEFEVFDSGSARIGMIYHKIIYQEREDGRQMVGFMRIFFKSNNTLNLKYYFISKISLKEHEFYLQKLEIKVKEIVEKTKLALTIDQISTTHRIPSNVTL